MGPVLHPDTVERNPATESGSCTVFYAAQAETNKEMERWLSDLRWRVLASENEIKKRNEPDRTRKVELRRTDETETALQRAVQRVVGIAVRYEEREEREADVDDEG